MNRRTTSYWDPVFQTWVIWFIASWSGDLGELLYGGRGADERNPEYLFEMVGATTGIGVDLSKQKRWRGFQKKKSCSQSFIGWILESISRLDPIPLMSGLLLDSLAGVSDGLDFVYPVILRLPVVNLVVHVNIRMRIIEFYLRL